MFAGTLGINELEFLSFPVGPCYSSKLGQWSCKEDFLKEHLELQQIKESKYH